MKIQIPTLKQSDIYRFQMKVHRGGPSECWPWTGSSDETGRGMMRINRQLFKAPRIAYFLEHHLDPGDLCVLHNCDNPNCVNPSHLYAGDKLQNARDREERGRSNRRLGEQHGNAVLKTGDVLFIRQSPLKGIELARKFAISEATVSAIRKCRIWRHIQPRQTRCSANDACLRNCHQGRPV